MEEKWKSIEGYEGLYEISTMGRVKSIERKVKHRNIYITLKEKILKPVKNKYYLKVCLWKNGKRESKLIHRLVAETFIHNPNNLPEVNHLDENKTNNNVNNLEWSDRCHNCNFGTRNKRISKALTGCYNTKISKPVKCIETGLIFPSTMEVQRKLGFDNGKISKCCNGKLKSAYKLHWKWAE